MHCRLCLWPSPIGLAGNMYCEHCTLYSVQYCIWHLLKVTKWIKIYNIDTPLGSTTVWKKPAKPHFRKSISFDKIWPVRRSDYLLWKDKFKTKQNIPKQNKKILYFIYLQVLIFYSKILNSYFSINQNCICIWPDVQLFTHGIII